MNPETTKQKFLIGVATAAHQIEGDNTYSDWWKYEHLNEMADRTSGKALNSYHLYTTDRKLIQDLGANSYRFSIEWARIEPVRGEYKWEEIEHYKHQIQDLKDHGLTPIVTLHHFTNPAWFEDMGGWPRKDAWQDFANYCKVLLAEIGEMVDWYIIINEPNVLVGGKYCSNDIFPPGISYRKGYKAYRNLAHAHNEIYKIIKKHSPTAQASTTIQDLSFVPANKAWYSFPVGLYSRFINYLSTDLFIRWIKNSMDFMALNFYSFRSIRLTPFSKQKMQIVPAYLNLDSDKLEQDPNELETVVRGYFNRYKIPIMITENGTAAADQYRRQYLKSIQNILLSLRADEAIQLIGFMYWTLVDNFEWALGYRIKYGLYSFDPVTFERIPKESVEDFKQLVRAIQNN